MTPLKKILPLKFILLLLVFISLRAPLHAQCKAKFWMTGISYDSLKIDDSSHVAHGYYVFFDTGDGDTSTQRHFIHVYRAPGIYRVCLRVFDSVNQCVDRVCKNVQCYLNAPLVFDNSSIEPALDQEEKIDIYPNPANEMIFVSIKNSLAKSAEIRIYNTSGKLLLKNNQDVIDENIPVQVNIKDLPVGAYILNVIPLEGFQTRPYLFFKM